jgi:TRAP-type C4-dicarboxylate transport system permease small subunit
MGRLIQRFTYLLSRTMEAIAGIALVFMMTLTTCDVILRGFSRPIIGTYEMVALTGAVVIGFSLPITSWLRGQIFVDFFYQKFPKFWRDLLNVITRLMALTLFLFVGWNLMILASDMVRSGQVSLTLQLPFYPIAYGMGFACFVQCLAIISDLVKIAGGQYE